MISDDNPWGKRSGFATLKRIQNFCEEYKTANDLTSYLNHVASLPDGIAIFSVTVRYSDKQESSDMITDDNGSAKKERVPPLL